MRINKSKYGKGAKRKKIVSKLSRIREARKKFFEGIDKWNEDSIYKN